MLSVSSVVLPLSKARAEATYGTEVFQGNATYLIQERFGTGFNMTANNNTNNAVLSGWEVDYRGGNVATSGGKAVLTDSNGYEKITLNRKFMSHSGDNLVLETAFSYLAFTEDGLYIRVGGEGKDALYLTVSNGYICLIKGTGAKAQLTQCTADTTYNIKAEFSSSKQKVKLWINGSLKGTFAYKNTADSLDEFEIGTGVEQVSKINLNYVYMYVNYAVNETFMAAPENSVPSWWSTSGNACIVPAPGSPYNADPNGFSLAPSSTLERSFDTQSGKTSIAWEMLIPSGCADGMKISAGIGSEYAVFSATNGKFTLNGSDVYTYTNNVWYKTELVTDGSSADVYINNALRAENIPLSGSSFDFIRFNNTSSQTVIVDDITVSKAFEASDFADYPVLSEIAQSDYNIGMVIYPMWREGIHYGWDAITPYEERTPYLGYYTGGSREVADWDNKWLLEHGFDHAIFPFARPDITEAGGQVNFSVRGEALHDGYMNSEYKNQLDFSIMLCSASASNYKSADEFIQNVQPYLVEHYFKNPSYKSMNNKLLIYSYDFDNIATQLGGDDQLHAVLASLDARVKNIDNRNGGTYDGIIFMADISATNESYVNSYISTQSPSYTVYKWHYTWGSDKYENIINGIKNEYSGGSNSVASIPMGFDNTPWKYNEIGFISPEGIKSICDAVKANKGSDDPNLVVFTCWDEWGEGHFFAPSNLHGFDYLNVARNAFTSLGVKTNEDRPGQEAISRMGVLHPQGRQILKIRKDSRKYTSQDLSGLTSLGSKTLITEAGSSIGNCSRSRTSVGFLKYNYTFNVTGSPATVTYNFTSPSIDASKITAVKINGYAQNSSEMVLYIQTNTSGSMDNTDFRFSGSCDGTTTTTDNILLPDNPEALNGTIQKIRFNPSANTSSGSKFQLNTIEFYTGNISTKVYVGQLNTDSNGHPYINDVEYDITSPVQISDTAYIPAYQFFFNMSAYPMWDKASQTLTVKKDGKEIILRAGSNIMTLNGEDITLSYAPYYSDGNLFIPYTGVTEHLDYRAQYNQATKTIKYYNTKHDEIDSYKNTNAWEFNIDDYDEGWSGSGVFKPMVVKNGMLHVAASTKDPVLTIGNLSIPKEEAKYAVLRILKTDRAEAGMLRLYDETTSASGVVYRFSLKPTEEIQEFVIDLENDYTANSTYTNTYQGLADTITKLRLDPMDNTGSVYIDSIRFLSEKPGTFDHQLKAYGWESENMVQLDTEKNRYVYTNMPNSQGNTTSTVLPATETVDGYSDVIKLIPAAGANNGIFTIDKVWYNGNSEYVSVLCTDKRIVKLSFWYKGIANGSAINFENRKGGLRDGEEFSISDVSSSEWKYFEGYIDMSNETFSSVAERWLSLRVHRNGYTTDDGGIYLRDYKMVCLDESKTISAFGGDTVAVCPVINEEVETELVNPYVYISGFDTSGNIKNIIAESYPRKITVTINAAPVQETAKYYYFRPAENTTDIKGYFWDNMRPLSSVTELEK